MKTIDKWLISRRKEITQGHKVIESWPTGENNSGEVLFRESRWFHKMKPLTIVWDMMGSIGDHRETMQTTFEGTCCPNVAKEFGIDFPSCWRLVTFIELRIVVPGNRFHQTFQLIELKKSLRIIRAFLEAHLFYQLYSGVLRRLLTRSTDCFSLSEIVCCILLRGKVIELLVTLRYQLFIIDNLWITNNIIPDEYSNTGSNFQDDVDNTSNMSTKIETGSPKESSNSWQTYRTYCSEILPFVERHFSCALLNRTSSQPMWIMLLSGCKSSVCRSKSNRAKRILAV